MKAVTTPEEFKELALKLARQKRDLYTACPEAATEADLWWRENDPHNEDYRREKIEGQEMIRRAGRREPE